MQPQKVLYYFDQTSITTIGALITRRPESIPSSRYKLDKN